VSHAIDRCPLASAHHGMLWASEPPAQSPPETAAANEPRREWDPAPGHALSKSRWETSGWAADAVSAFTSCVPAAAGHWAATGHVWTAPGWQGISSRWQAWSEQPCVRPVSAVHMTAGHNALRGSGPGQKHAFDNALAQVGCPDRRVDRLCITCCSPFPTVHITPRARRDLVTPRVRRVLCSARP
jgi:hypothetical protein